MNFASPAPTNTAITDSKSMLSLPWRQWLFRLGNWWVSANKVNKLDGLQYVLSGATVSLSYHGPGTVITLPYKPLAYSILCVIGSTTQHLVVEPNQESVDLSAETQTITAWMQYLTGGEA